MKKELTPELTPLIEKMKPELSPIFEKKREPEPNRNHHLENDANWNRWFPLEPGNQPTLVQTPWNQAHAPLLVESFPKRPRTRSEASWLGGSQRYKQNKTN